MDLVLQSIAQIASKKEWPQPRLSPNEILDILLDRRANYERIDKILLEIKKLNDQRYVNIKTFRKIAKNEKKMNIFYFDDKHKLCCPQEYKELWDTVINRYSQLYEDECSSEYSDNFDWASDESGSCSTEEYWDYIVPEVKTTKNIVREIFI